MVLLLIILIYQFKRGSLKHGLVWGVGAWFTVPAFVPMSVLMSQHSFSQPHPRSVLHCCQKSMGRYQMIGYHPKETLHCCRVTLVVFNVFLSRYFIFPVCTSLYVCKHEVFCWYRQYAGHHLLCLLLTTSAFRFLRSCWLSLNPACLFKVPCLLQVLVAASQPLSHSLCLSSAPCSHIWL